MKIALLSSYTADLLPKEIDKHLKTGGIVSQWHIALFNQYMQEILAPESELKRFEPGVIILALDLDELISVSDKLPQLLSTASEQFPSAAIIVHNCAMLQPEPMHLLEWNTPDSKRLSASKINCKLSELTQGLPNIYVLDLEYLVLKHGSENLFDPRFYYSAKVQFSLLGIQKVAEQLATAILSITGRRKKCLVLDLDNTLWGGIIGEDGIEHINLSNDGIGKAFYDFQRKIEKLHDTGTVLAICSKNDKDIALEAINSHPYMVLREGKFAAIRINWDDKASNIRSISEELNLGLDSFVYLDDSAHEREVVRKLLPEVTVPDMPEDFSEYPKFLSGLPYFETFSFTVEDTRRGHMYAQERQRKDLQRSASSFDEFLKSLDIKMSVKEADNFTIPRIAQLTQKTNQFNLTTRRYAESDIREFSNNPSWRVFSASTSDKLGDSGIVGVAISEINGDTARLDTFLISCRVLGRGIEQAFLIAVLEILKKAGMKTCIAEYIRTKKNGMARDFLPTNGFALRDDYYMCDLQKAPEFPDWIEVECE